jgi:phosphatidylglycerol:prolipoprotein diacylglycerol transferase
MRPRIIEWLNHIFHTNIFTYLIPNYTVIFSIALLVVLFLFIRRVERDQLHRKTALALYFWAIIGVFLGGKLYGIIQTWLQEGHLHIALLSPSHMGMVSVGGLLGGLAVVLCYGYTKKIPVLPYLDTGAPFFGIAIGLVRIGCFLNGDDYGRLSFLPWAVQYPPGSYAYEDQVAMGLIKYSSKLSLPVHPVQLYMAAQGLALFGLLTWTRRYTMKNGGQLYLFFVVYLFFRFILEFFRGDPWRPFIGALSHVQCISLLLIPAILVVWIFTHRS